MWRSAIVWSIAFNAFAQNVPSVPAFEVADIRINTSGAEKSSGSLANGRLTLRNLPVRWLIAEAWTLNPDDVYGPSWLDDVRMDVIARAASPQTPDSDLRRMLQALLQDRLKLIAHFDKREKSVWALSLWKEPAKLTPSEPPAKPEDADCNRSRAGDRLRLTCQHETMAAFAHELPQYAGGFVTSTVIDQTSLSGAWDFSVEWTPLDQIESTGGLDLFAALRSQLNLQLNKKRLPVPVLVVDSVERTPAL